MAKKSQNSEITPEQKRMVEDTALLIQGKAPDRLYDRPVHEESDDDDGIELARDFEEDDRPKGKKKTGNPFSLRAIIQKYDNTLKEVLRIDSQAFSKEVGRDTDSPIIAEMTLTHWRHMKVALLSMSKALEILLPSHPVYRWGMGVPGMNRLTLGRILAYIPMTGPDSFKNFGQLRTWAGYCPPIKDPSTGKIIEYKDRKVKNQKIKYCSALRRAFYIAFSTMLKSYPLVAKAEKKALEKDPNYIPTSPKRSYVDIYYRYRVQYAERFGVGARGREWIEKNRPDMAHAIVDYKDWVPNKNGKGMRPEYPDKRQHHMAIRKVADVVLFHIWTVWRQSQGWPIRDPYSVEKQGHQWDYDPNDFTSKHMSDRKIAQHAVNSAERMVQLALAEAAESEKAMREMEEIVNSSNGEE